MANNSVQTDNYQVQQNEIQKEQDEKKQEQQGSVDALTYALMMVLDTVNVQQDMAETQSKALQECSLEQTKLNDQAGQMNFETVTKKKPSDSDLRKIQLNNDQVQAQRSYVSNQIMVVQQNAQTGQSYFNSDISGTEQSMSIYSKLASLLTQITNLVSSMTKSP